MKKGLPQIIMKVLQLGKFYPIRGGVEKVMYDLTEGLSKQGVDCDMLCALIDGKGRKINLTPRGNIIGCRTWVKVASTMISPSMISELRKRCSDYDIIHVHHPDPMAALTLKLSGYRGKVILHWHSDILRQRKMLRLYGPLQRWLIKRANLIIGTSPVYLAGSPSLKQEAHKCVALPIGVDRMKATTEAVQRIKDRYGRRKIVFSLGRLVSYKGFRNLIEAATMLPDDYAIVIGGDGPLRGELEEQVNRLGLSDRVYLPGFISGEELGAYFEACTVFCLSSVFKTEAFAIVQIEAMAAGRPVVATKIPGSGVPWVNAHGVSGLNVSTDDPKALAGAILDICTDTSTYNAFCERARNRYEQMFTKSKMIDDCKTIYENVLNNRY